MLGTHFHFQPFKAIQIMAHNEKCYLIWNYKRKMWWKSSRYGYTNNHMDAGKFRESEALEIVENANAYGTIEDVMVPDESIDNMRNTIAHAQ